MLLIAVPMVLGIFDIPKKGLAGFLRTVWNWHGVFTFTIYFSWLYSVGSRLGRELPVGMKMHRTALALSLIVPALYELVFIWIDWVKSVLDLPAEVWSLAVLLGNIPSLLCVIYALVIVAKTLRSVELERSVHFSDYAGELILIFFYPVGVWFIQPRVTRVVMNRQKS
jgi:hypothetical protein